VDWTHIITIYTVLLISIVSHEAAHALLAKWGGDPTAYLNGQVTLNPAPHIQREPFGTVILPLVMLLYSKGTMCFGYASAPYDPVWAERNPRKSALMSAAGPLSNFLLAGIAFVVLYYLCSTDVAMVKESHPFYKVVPLGDSPYLLSTTKILWAFLFLNLLLGLLNLIPLPPLDGAGVLEGLAPKIFRPLYAPFREMPMLTIMTFVVVFYLVPDLFWPVLGFALSLLP